MSLLSPQIRPAREVDLQRLHEAAAADNHGVFWPTHVVRKDDDFIGYLSVGAVPSVLLWMDTKKTKVRDSVAVATFIDNILCNAPGVLVPVAKNSPFYPLMEHAGFTLGHEGALFMKRF